MTDKEYYDEKWAQHEALLYGCVAYITALAFVITCLVMLAGCKTQYVPVETVRTEHHHSTDTVRQTDSIFREKETVIREANSGDSALLAKLGIQLRQNQKAILILQKELERERNKQEEHYGDTIIKVEEKQVPVPVEKKVPFWEKAKLASIGFSASLILIAAIGLVIWIRKRYRRK